MRLKVETNIVDDGVKKEKTINILGTEYEFITSVDPDDKDMEGCDGVCFYNRKQIKIVDFYKRSGWKDEPKESIERRFKEVARHEIVHAFLRESGLADSSLRHESWAVNEEMVDWIATQFPKIYDVYKKLDIL